MMRTLPLPCIVIAVLMVVGTTLAHAASLGGVDARTLGAWDEFGDPGLPHVETWANFDGTNSTNLNGYSLDGPGTWTAGPGTWTILGDQAVSDATASSKLWVSVGTENASVVATLDLDKNGVAGLLALGTASVWITAIYSKDNGGTVTLYKHNGGATPLASVTGVGGMAVRLMELDATTNTLKVSVDGTEVLTYTLTAGEITVYKTASNTRFGIVADNDFKTTFDDFHVDS